MKVKSPVRIFLKYVYSCCQKFLGIFGFQLSRSSVLADIEDLRSSNHLVNLLEVLPPLSLERVFRLRPMSRSQFHQDLFVLSMLDFKRKGYFVEFGATDGLLLSNTYLLEKEFDWTGVLSEPAKVWQADLLRNRKGDIDFRCVWSSSGNQLAFSETASHEYSTIDAFSDLDLNSIFRRNKKNYLVESVSLGELLASHNAPQIIDYLSIDTEGSEYEILKNFDFASHSFRIITCEHNFTENRLRIRELFTANGYTEIFHNATRVEDWFVRRDLIPENVEKFLFNGH